MCQSTQDCLPGDFVSPNISNPNGVVSCKLVSRPLTSLLLLALLTTNATVGKGQETVEPQPASAITLPSSEKQSWRTFDISKYTTSIKSAANPEKQILNWILRETGTDTWFGEPMGVLSVGRHKIRCYHTPEVQQKVSNIVERFLKTAEQDEVFGVQILSIANPNWRAKSLNLLKRIQTNTPGVEGWTTSKENAAQLFNELRKRSDFRQPVSPLIVTESGQSKKVVRMYPLNYFRSIQIDQRRFPPFRVEPGRIDEGFVFDLSSLRSSDGKSMDAEVFCEIKQVDQFHTVNIDVPAPTGQPQKHPISVPQLSTWRLKERFQWPANEVLILSAGVVASPDRKTAPAINLQNVFEPQRRRADILLLIDCKGLYPRGKAPRSLIGLAPVPQRR